MWSLILFDLPTLTRLQRRDAARFRNLLLDLGYWRVQFSVYARYTPTISHVPLGRVRSGLPPDGDIRILYLTDKQWSHSVRISNAGTDRGESPPEQLTIF